MKARHVLALAALAFASAASAQSLKPGLWEITQKVSSSSGEAEKAMAQMQQQLASMPPEQRKKMEEMMAARGLSPGGAGGGMSVKVCMTKEMAERAEAPMQHQSGDCKTTQQSRSGNTMKIAYACTTPPSSGEGEMTFTSPEAYNTKMVVNTTVRGKPEKMNMDSTGKWMGTDCGTVKPIVMPPKK
ncbi:MAG: DUF3617 domain-containing protein [Ramlibacter sp.]